MRDDTLKLERRAPRWMYWIESAFPKLGGWLGWRWLIRNQPQCGHYNIAPGGLFRATSTRPIAQFDVPIECRSGTVDIVGEDA